MLLRIGHRIINTDTIVEIDVGSSYTRILTTAMEAGLSGTVRPYEIRLFGAEAAPLLEWLDLAATDLTLERETT